MCHLLSVVYSVGVFNIVSWVVCCCVQQILAKRACEPVLLFLNQLNQALQVAESMFSSPRRCCLSPQRDRVCAIPSFAMFYFCIHKSRRHLNITLSSENSLGEFHLQLVVVVRQKLKLKLKILIQLSVVAFNCCSTAS